jgi:hypothetical protein
MMSIEMIKELNAKRGKEAQVYGKMPFMLYTEEQKNFLDKIPNIGDFRPKGFKFLRELFVDASGFGAEDEAAMTFGQFVKEAQIGKAYAIIEAGQFQVRIAEFEKVDEQ